MHVIGVDACKGGWVAVSLTGGTVSGVRTGATLGASLGASLGEVINGASLGEVISAISLGEAITGGPVAVGIDMPLGLLEAGWREADQQAHRLLGPRRSSVFAIPPRAVWAQRDYAAANLLCRELTGKGMSVQAWNLRPKLLEANEFLAKSPWPLYEVHPELAFAALAGQPLPLSKHVAPGRELRRDLLTTAGIVLPRTATVDVLDAAAAAWSTQRIAAGQAVTIPDTPQHDSEGREIAIRY